MLSCHSFPSFEMGFVILICFGRDDINANNHYLSASHVLEEEKDQIFKELISELSLKK